MSNQDLEKRVTTLEDDVQFLARAILHLLTGEAVFSDYDLARLRELASGA